jgi:hypothetical protein
LEITNFNCCCVVSAPKAGKRLICRRPLIGPDPR